MKRPRLLIRSTRKLLFNPLMSPCKGSKRALISPSGYYIKRKEDYIMLRIEIETGNAAFEHPDQLDRILENVSKRINEGQTEGKLRDINGNTVGFFNLN